MIELAQLYCMFAAFNAVHVCCRAQNTQKGLFFQVFYLNYAVKTENAKIELNLTSSEMSNSLFMLCNSCGECHL
jgi:hypothetical protein